MTIIRQSLTTLAFLMLSAATITISACTGKGDNNAAKQQEQAASVGADNKKMTKEYVAQRVKTIYKEVFAVYKDAQKNGTLPDVYELNELYCSKGWQEMYVKVGEKDLQHPGEMGFFEADYWICGQDWDTDIHISDVKVEDVSEDGAIVSLTVHNFGEHQVELELAFEDGDWRIANFTEVNDNLDIHLNWGEEMENYLNE